MYRKKQPEKPLFAEVKLTDEDVSQQVSNQSQKEGNLICISAQVHFCVDADRIGV